MENHALQSLESRWIRPALIPLLVCSKKIALFVHTDLAWFINMASEHYPEEDEVVLDSILVSATLSKNMREFRESL